MNVEIPTPKWSKPLLAPRRYKGAKGGRGSGKSHYFAESVVEALLIDKDLQAVCIREVQKSLKFSAKALIEKKIKAFGVSHLFEINTTEIKRIDGDGIIIFMGMQDHTADSVKSLEGFKIAWVEEAQTISEYSLSLLLPTIRESGSEIWFSWNPKNTDDPVDLLFKGDGSGVYEINDISSGSKNWGVDNESAVCVHVNFTQNSRCPQELKDEAKRHRKNKPDSYNHVWLGGYDDRSERIVFAGKYQEKDFEVDYSYGSPLLGIDFGFSQDPTVGIELYIKDGCLWSRRACGSRALELNDTSSFLTSNIPSMKDHVSRADCSRPESISYLKNDGMPLVKGCVKGKGSVVDGVEFMKSFDRIYVHPDAEPFLSELGKYSYKVDKRTGDILPLLEDKDNHYIDAGRYALEPIMKKKVIDYGAMN